VSHRMKYATVVVSVMLLLSIVVTETLINGSKQTAAHEPLSLLVSETPTATPEAFTLPTVTASPLEATAAPDETRTEPTAVPEEVVTSTQEVIDPEVRIPRDELGLPQHIDLSTLLATIDEVVFEVEGMLEIVVALPDGTLLYERDSTEPMEAASLYKLAVMVEIYRQREAGLLTLDDTILLLPDYFLEDDEVFSSDSIGAVIDLQSLLVYMIDYSSNVAAAALLARAGTDNVNATMLELGFSCTEIRWTPGIWVGIDSYAPSDPELPAAPLDDEIPDQPDPFQQEDPSEAEEPISGDRPVAGTTVTRTLLGVSSESDEATHLPRNNERADAAKNVSCAADVASLYAGLLRGDIVSTEASDEMLELLKGQVISDRIPAYLPEGTVTAHKTGNWEGLIHDAGVIWAPLGPIVVAVMSDIGDEGLAVRIIATVALAAYALNS
jgi:beta-lactamase class A